MTFLKSETLMKIRMKLLAVAASALLLPLGSCDSTWGDGPVGAQEFGTVRMTEDKKASILLDASGEYTQRDLGDILYRMAADKDGQRVIASYYFEDDSRHPGELIGLNKVLTKNVFEMTPADEDSIGNDRIDLLNAWISGGHINVQFGIYGGGFVSHFINLVSLDEAEGMDEIKDGYKYLELRHNAFADGWNYQFVDYASFPITWPEDEYKGYYIGYTNYQNQKLMIEVKTPSDSDDEAGSGENEVPQRRALLK